MATTFESPTVVTTPQPTHITEREAHQIARANASGLVPVVFVHGLWLLASSWERWAELFEASGFVALTPGWPDDPESVAEAKAHPELLAGKRINDIAAHHEDVVRRLRVRPAIIGHSFGGLLAQILAGRGLSAATVAIDPAPFRGVLPLPLSAIKSAWPALKNPANWRRAVPLTYAEFRFGFANAVPEDEAMELYEKYAVPGSGAPLFQAATANLNPWTQAKVETRDPSRGPLLIMSGDNDNTVPATIAAAMFKRQLVNPGVTEIARVANRGHTLTIDSGWREVAGTALAFVRRYATPSGTARAS
jgi:pimeloyl-ACP methyl ester carboxylesterase